MSFQEQFNPLLIHELVTASLAVTPEHVAAVLTRNRLTVQDLPILLSPAARAFLEPLAQKAHALTIKRFGRTMQLYIPMYLSNVCQNQCVYCGYNTKKEYARVTLSLTEIAAEARALREKQFRHILLLTGETPYLNQQPYIDYMTDAVCEVAQHFDSVGLEIQPLTTDGYAKLIAAGADSLTIYQETYHPESYERFHRSGKKRDMNWRLDTPDRAGKAGFYRLNVGILLGLYDWRFEALALGAHVSYLMKHYWRTRMAVSFPRIRAISGGFQADVKVSDREFVQLILAFRLVFPDIGITLSTRESAEFRNHVIPLGVTTLSAESRTNPGGYTGKSTENQFQISDERDLNQMRDFLLSNGYDPVMKDWAQVLNSK